MSQMSEALDRRPGLVTFAAIMMFLLGGFQLTFALLEYWHATWFALNTYGSFGGYLWLWGILDTILALVAFYAGASILAGGTFGRVVGVAIAMFSAIRWFFYMPAAPWIGAVVIAVDILIVYGLVSHSEYFDAASATGKM